MATARVTVNCRTCHTVTRIIVPTYNLTHNGPIYCPYCASNNTALTQDSDLDWQEVMEESYGVPWSQLEPIYEAWNQQHTFAHFHDYVMQLIKENPHD